jgi:hypothetical protein
MTCAICEPGSIGSSPSWFSLGRDLTACFISSDVGELLAHGLRTAYFMSSCRGTSAVGLTKIGWLGAVRSTRATRLNGMSELQLAFPGGAPMRSALPGVA